MEAKELFDCVTPELRAAAAEAARRTLAAPVGRATGLHPIRPS